MEDVPRSFKSESIGQGRRRVRGPRTLAATASSDAQKPAQPLKPHQDEMGPLFPSGQARSLGPTLGTALRFLINQPAARCVALDLLVSWVPTYPSSPRLSSELSSVPRASVGGSGVVFLPAGSPCIPLTFC